ncbi:MFS transporter [Frankia sp. CNm7]|uniref:MFS transporter n=2 Tax=Frankia nepalensis TaxID=1836974 RepID=A0A937REI0_9ACTN|nr:MFS transporter [Frankia nepalensis]MBL7511533.1 MFS transporter [Frankia nepalensis]MBL7519248.1 MFS transporter [Frankia nepalensis]MBL7628527.1 MFS transporter [Frankia nepalensis]
MTQSMMIPLLPTLPAELDTSITSVEWLLTSTMLVAAVAVPVLGRLGDMFGKRRLLLVALSALVVGSLIAALTDDIRLMILARAVHGLASAAIPLGISLLAALLPAERVGSAAALVSAMMGVGSALALPTAGLIADNTDYHVLFWFLAASGVVTFVLVLTIVPEAPGRVGGRVDLVGAALLSAVLLTLLVPLAESAHWGWASPRVFGLLAASALLLLVFGLAESRARNPLVDLASLRRRDMVATNFCSVMFTAALFASMIGTVGYVQAPEETGYGFGTSLLVGGLFMVPTGVGMLLLAPVSARLVARRGASRTLALGAVIVASGWAVRIALTGSLWHVLLGTTLVGAGTGIGYAAMPALIHTFTPLSGLAAANGLNMLFRSIGSALASAIGGSLIATYTLSLAGETLPSLTAYRLLFAVCGLAAVVAAVAALTIRDRPSVTSSGPFRVAAPLPSPPR